MIADFEPIALISATPWLIAAKKDLPANDLKGLVAWLKANPDKASLGTAGVGSPSHIGGVLLQNVTGTRFQLVPYRGTAPVIPDLVSGQIDMSILDPVTCLPQFRAGKIKVFAVMAKKPHRECARRPDRGRGRRAWPSHGAMAGDLGAEGHAEGHHRQAQRRGRQTLADPAVRAKFAEQSYEVGPREEQTPEYLGAFHKAETDKWWPIIKAAGIKGG